MKKSSVSRSLAAVLASTLLLAACGGGGGGGPRPPRSSDFSEAVAGCAVPTQRQFLRTYLDEVYLWYREIPAVDAAPYTTQNQLGDYFAALTALPKDRFSRAIESGKHATVVQSLVQLDPSNLLASHAVQIPPNIRASGGGRRVGYVQLANHAEGAQDELIAAFLQLRDQGGVDELVLDLRENTGGFVYVALTAASMITGPAKDGQIFERLVFNDKVGESTLNFSGKVQFSDGVSPRFKVGDDLPRLNLSRVFVLTGHDANPDPDLRRITCSASESIINSLRGIDVQVIRLGETTCGKPYGFREKVNCGWSYFAIEFQGFNQKGFGDYQGGFEPMCRMTDQVALAARGTLADPIYSGALYYMDNNNTCPPTSTATNVQSAGVPIVSSPQRAPLGAARILLPEMLPR